MAPLLKFQFAAHLTLFDGHQRRNQTSATTRKSCLLHNGKRKIMLGSSGWQMEVQSSLESWRKIARSSKIHLARCFQKSSFNANNNGTLRKNTCSIGHPHMPGVNLQDPPGQFLEGPRFHTLVGYALPPAATLDSPWRWCQPKVKNLTTP